MAKILVTGAGSVQSNGVVNSLLRSEIKEEIIGVGSDPTDLVLCKAHKKYLVPYSTSPDYKDALLNRAYAYEAISQFKNALADVDRVNQLTPDSSFVYFYKGLIFTQMKQYDSAYRCFQVSDSLNPDNPETIINMATIHYFKDDLPQAEAYIDRALELQSEDPNAFNLMSLVALEKEEYTRALAQINRALDLVPEEPYFINNRGFIYLQMDELELAIKDINRSIVLNPKNGWAYRNKGIYLLKTGEAKEGIDLFNRAMATNEFIDEIYYYLGLAHQMLSNEDQACQAWKLGAAQNELKSKTMSAQNCD